MVVRTDDAIQAERGQLIELSGIELPIHPYYVLVAVFLAVAVPFGLMVHWGGGSMTSAVLYSSATATLAQAWVGRQLTKGVTFVGLAQTCWAEAYWWYIARVDAVHEREARKPGLLIAKPLTRKR
ncbi:hypothetical protein KIH74_22710 [Kineosporia sp. J2-2]|uniref:Uncharacterized protein n=1 Tax=Kineosporia corallincola TaxID=2835133 RepID=A0ABS5TKY9_9ACTN|nr:hypothetical protein [Kineosporia corallincola]MBT0771770.1 hypothetical protein [Kineosporia corallincola]